MGEVLEESLGTMTKHESRKDKIFQKFKATVALGNRFSDTAEGLSPSGSLVKISLGKTIFQIAPVVPREYSSSCLSCSAVKG